MTEEKRDEAICRLQEQIDELDNVCADNGNKDQKFQPIYHSWVRGTISLPEESNRNDDDGGVAHNRAPSSSQFYPTKRTRFFDKHGFIYIPSFATLDEVSSMKSAMKELVENEWHPPGSKSSLSESEPQQSTVVFRTDNQQVKAQGSSDYFLDSSNKVHFFAEKDAMTSALGDDEQQGDNNDNADRLKPIYHDNKIGALNKAGHGLHLLPASPFQKYTQSSKISSLLHELGYIDPVVPQSMYIFKQAHIGGEVTSHQDSTFLYTEPRQTCIGLWLALDDATIENGCLWIRPGSHKEGLRRQFVRNPLHFGKGLVYNDTSDVNRQDRDDEDENNKEGGGDRSQPQLIFRSFDNDNNKNIPWEGSLPKDSMPIPQCTGLYDNDFIPIPCKAGDLLAFCGELDHLSLMNTSKDARHTFQLHCVEGMASGITWSKENWLQYPKDVKFLRLS